MIDPTTSGEVYDSILLAGVASPGICDIGEPKRDPGWETQEGKGSDGGETVNNGRKLMSFDVSFKLWNDVAKSIRYLDDWDNFEKLFDVPVTEGAEKALDIYHPQLEGLGIRSVVVGPRARPKPNGNGTSTAVVTFIEYAPASKKTSSGKPSGSKANGGGSGPSDGSGTGPSAVKEPDPNQDVKDQTDDLIEEWNDV